MSPDLDDTELACWQRLKAALNRADRATDEMRAAAGEAALAQARERVLEALYAIDAAQDEWAVSLANRLERLRRR